MALGEDEEIETKERRWKKEEEEEKDGPSVRWSALSAVDPHDGVLIAMIAEDVVLK